MKDLTKEMEISQKKQEDRLKAQIAARERRKQAAKQKSEEKTKGLDDEVIKIAEEIEELAEQQEELASIGIATKENKAELAEEKNAEAKRLEMKKEE